MFGTFFDAGCSVGIFSIGISLPLVLGGVVDVHGGTFLFANTVIVEVLASLKITKTKTTIAPREEAGGRKFLRMKTMASLGSQLDKAIHGK